MSLRCLRGLPLTATISLVVHGVAFATAYTFIEWHSASDPIVIAVELVAGTSGEDEAPPRSSASRSQVAAPSALPTETVDRASEPLQQKAAPHSIPEPRTQTARPEEAPMAPDDRPLPPLPLAKPTDVPDAAVEIEIGAVPTGGGPLPRPSIKTPAPTPETASRSAEETSAPERTEGERSEEQTASTAQGRRIGQSTLTPAPGNPRPRYPLIARKRGYEGRVLLTVQVAGNGYVADLVIARSSGYTLLDDAALDAVKRWRFHPVAVGDGPVDIVVEVPVTFRLEDTTATQR